MSTSPRAIVRGLRQRGVDVMPFSEAGMLGASDEEHLRKARDERRVIFTQDQDFLRLHADGADHAGIAYVRQGASIGRIVRGLMLIHQVLDADGMAGQLEYL